MEPPHKSASNWFSIVVRTVRLSGFWFGLVYSLSFQFSASKIWTARLHRRCPCSKASIFASTFSTFLFGATPLRQHSCYISPPSLGLLRSWNQCCHRNAETRCVSLRLTHTKSQDELCALHPILVVNWDLSMLVLGRKSLSVENELA